MRRRRLWWAAAGLAGLVAVGVFVLWPRAERIAASFHQIQAGMSLAEVEAILGPRGDHSTAPEDYSSPTKFQHLAEESWGTGETQEEWEFDPARIRVFFDASGKVAGAKIIPVRRIEWFDRLLSPAMCQWRKWFPEK